MEVRKHLEATLGIFIVSFFIVVIVVVVVADNAVVVGRILDNVQCLCNAKTLLANYKSITLFI